MILRKIRFLLLSLILFTNTILPSIVAGTLIKSPQGFISAENITVDDIVIAYHQEKLSTTTITHTLPATTDILIAITTQNGTVYACPDQQFFDPVLQQWITAQDITIENIFLNAQLEHCPCLNIETIHVPGTKIYRITTNYPHNFFATEQELLVHNTLPIVIGVAWLFGEGIKFAGITIGAAILGSFIGVELFNRQKQKGKVFAVSFEIGPGGYTPDPDDDENNERKFNTITKSEFFKSIKNDYEHYRDGIYRRKKGTKGIEKAEYLQWDYLHGDVEAYTKGGKHLGSIDPRTLRIYKGPVVRTLPL